MTNANNIQFYVGRFYHRFDAFLVHDKKRDVQPDNRLFPLRTLHFTIIQPHLGDVFTLSMI